ncbi:MAG: hypothetical protein ACLSVD_03790 [Eggerthellaceae bacterium]
MADFSLKLGDTPVAQVNADAIAGCALARRRAVGVDEGWWQPGCRIWLACNTTRRVARSRREEVRVRRRIRLDHRQGKLGKR